MQSCVQAGAGKPICIVWLQAEGIHVASALSMLSGHSPDNVFTVLVIISHSIKLIRLYWYNTQ